MVPTVGYGDSMLTPDMRACHERLDRVYFIMCRPACDAIRSGERRAFAPDLPPRPCMCCFECDHFGWVSKQGTQVKAQLRVLCKCLAAHTWLA